MFVAINYITCKEHYRERFEYLFSTRAKAIDTVPGFQSMNVLKPQKDGEDYLVVSYWENEDAFKNWTRSAEFLEGHKRAFADIAVAKEKGEEPPMHSSFKVYSVLTN
ncbi:MAG: antibiotic biosynthesis monooxygenase [Candidatus Kapaibacterium sp.]